MELLLNSEQSMLKDSATSFARRSAGAARLRALPDLPARFPAREFAEAAEAGWLSLLLPEEEEGSGLGLTELCLVAEQLGAALSALPVVVASGGIVALAGNLAGSNTLRALCRRCQAGEALVVPALAQGNDGAGEGAEAARRWAPFATAAAGFVADVVRDGEPALIFVARENARVTERIAIDGTVMGEVAWDPGAPVEVLARGEAAAALRRRITVTLALGHAAELTGLMQTAAERTRDYLRVRQQFGRPIGSFQALQHRCVNDQVRTETTRALLYELARGTRFDEELEALAGALKARAGETALAVIASSIQMHGAIGFTDEHDMGLIYKRAMTLAASGPDRSARARSAAFLAARTDATLPRTRPVADEGFRAEVRDFLARTLRPELCHLPTRPTVEVATWWHRQLYERGFIAPRWPKQYGGMEASLEQQLILAEELGRVGAPELSGQAIGHIGPILMAFGTEEQKQRHLPGMLSGEVLWCQGYSEPGAGSDLASLRTAAVRDGDALVVDGSKIWTTWGHHAHWMFALVRTDPAAVKQAGITFLLIDMKSPGITARPIRTIAGDDELAQVFFDGVRVPLANVVGEINDGWRIANALLAQERLQSASPQKCLALLTRLKRAAAACGASDDPAFRDKLAAAEVETLALAAAYQQAVDLIRAGRKLGPETSFLKLAGSELTQHLSGLMLEASGTAGAIAGPLATADGAVYPAGTFLQTRRETIFAGSSEIQRNIIAKRVLNLP
jgi:3-oxochol-4-en-24-oyl-CoA dehydrogenase